MTLLYARRKRRGGCDEAYARWRAAEALYDEATKAESGAGYEKEMRQAAFDRAGTDRAVAKADVLGTDDQPTPRRWRRWRRRKLEYDSREARASVQLDAAKRAHEAATERRKELEAEWQEARRIYEECIGQAAVE